MGNVQENFAFFGEVFKIENLQNNLAWFGEVFKIENAQNNLAWFGEVSKIAQETRFTREEVYKCYLKYWEKHSNQKIDRRRLVDIYNSFTSAELTLEACDNIFKSIGEDKNGTISFRDLMLAYNTIAYGWEDEKLKWAFKVYDTNNDGFISLSELTKIIKSFQSKFETSNSKTKAIEIMSKTYKSNLSLLEFKRLFHGDCQEIAELVRKGIGYKKYSSEDDSF